MAPSQAYIQKNDISNIEKPKEDEHLNLTLQSEKTLDLRRGNTLRLDSPDGTTTKNAKNNEKLMETPASKMQSSQFDMQEIKSLLDEKMQIEFNRNSE